MTQNYLMRLLAIILLFSAQISLLSTEKEDEFREEATDWFYYRSEYAALLKKKKEIELEVKKLREEKIALEKQNTELRTQVTKLETELESAKESRLVYQKEMETKIATLESTITNLNSRQVTLEKTISEMQNQAVASRSTNTETITRIETERNTLIERNKTLLKEIETLKTENTALTQKIADADKKLAESEKKLEESEKRVAELENENAKDSKSKDELTQLREEKEKLAKERDELQQTIASLNKELKNVRNSESRLAEENLQLKSDLEKFMAGQREELENGLEREIKNGDVEVSQSGKRLIINLYDKITFDSGSAKLKREGKQTLNKILDTLSKYKNQKIYIEGNTDNVPIKNSKYPDNWHLSVARSVSVMKYLLKTARLYPKNLTVAGNGQYNPLAENSSPKTRALNRRVDLIVVPEELGHNN